MKHFKLYMAALLVVGFASFAFADGYDLTFKSVSELPTTTTAPASGDFKLIFNASDNKFEKYAATSEKLAGSFNGTIGATTPSSGVFTTLTASGIAALNGANTSTGSFTYTRTPAADSGTTNQTSKVALTAPVDTTGTNTHNAYDVALTVSNATGGTNTVNGFKFENYTGDAQVNVNAINIGTSDALGTANAISVGSGWDLGLSIASPASLTSTLAVTGVTTVTGGIAGPAPAACGSTCTISVPGGITRLDTAGGSAATLPAATGTGNVYKLYVSVATTSAQDKVLLTTVTDTIIGTAVGENAGTAKVFVGNAGTYHSIQMPFTGSVPSGGFIGDTITCTDVAATIYKCDIQYQAGTTPTTPYSTSTT